jgi:hypothetical protein
MGVRHRIQAGGGAWSWLPSSIFVTDSPGMIVGSQPVGGRLLLGPLGVQPWGVRDGLVGGGDRSRPGGLPLDFVWARPVLPR